MKKPDPAGGAEKLLACFLNAGEEDEAAQWLERLLDGHAAPLILAIVNRKLEVCLGGGRSHGSPQTLKELDAEDVYCTAVGQLLGFLWRQRKGQAEAEPIHNFPGFVAQIAFNAFALHVRRLHPRRHRFRHKLLMLLEGHTVVSGFAVWACPHRDTQLCGFADRNGQPAGATDNYRRWQEEPGRCGKAAFGNDAPSELPLPELVARVFRWVGTPMEVEELVDGLTELLELRERETSPTPEEGEPTGELAGGVHVEDEAVKSLQHGQLVPALWCEICGLPLAQKRAFLLHLGQDEVMLFVSHGCCSLRRLAEVLETSLPELASWLERLPLPDDRIGEPLGLTGRAVINRRVSAQRRLSRRLGSWGEEQSDSQSMAT